MVMKITMKREDLPNRETAITCHQWNKVEHYEENELTLPDEFDISDCFDCIAFDGVDCNSDDPLRLILHVRCCEKAHHLIKVNATYAEFDSTMLRAITQLVDTLEHIARLKVHVSSKIVADGQGHLRAPLYGLTFVELKKQAESICTSARYVRHALNLSNFAPVVKHKLDQHFRYNSVKGILEKHNFNELYPSQDDEESTTETV